MDTPQLTNMKRGSTSTEREGGDIETRDEYPYGLQLNLGKDELAKLGMAMPTVGGELVLCAKVKVTSTREETGSDPYRNVELQITDMALASPKTEQERKDEMTSAFYPKGE
jgi:hypothetical protein